MLKASIHIPLQIEQPPVIEEDTSEDPTHMLRSYLMSARYMDVAIDEEVSTFSNNILCIASLLLSVPSQHISAVLQVCRR
jgi:hypothetical protein